METNEKEIKEGYEQIDIEESISIEEDCEGFDEEE